MEYQINVDRVNKRATKQPINPHYEAMPNEWVGKFIITIWKGGKRDAYLYKFIQKVFDKKKDALQFARKFVKSRRKTTCITVGGKFRKELI